MGRGLKRGRGLVAGAGLRQVQGGEAQRGGAVPGGVGTRASKETHWPKLSIAWGMGRSLLAEGVEPQRESKGGGARRDRREGGPVE